MKANKLTKETVLDLGIEKKNRHFNVGDTVKVALKIKEGDKERIQPFEGDVIAIHNNGISSTFTVRKISNGVAVERIIPIHSPIIESITFLRKGDVRRAKLYYIRERQGKAARVKEKVLTREQKEHIRQKSES